MSDTAPIASRPSTGALRIDSESGMLLPPTLAQRPGGRPVATDPQFPGYYVHKEIARGGMGRVLAAHDLVLDREVAIKVLLHDSPDSDLAQRFRQEAKITAKLPHPGIPPVYALGDLPDGSPFLAMKLVEGRTLAALLHGRRSPADDLPRFVQVFEQVCLAVGFAHSQGIVHRDLKPSNVMVGAFGEVQVMDWGLAKELRNPGCESRDHATRPPAARSGFRPPDLTEVGVVLGTPSYMAPEQARGEETDPRADVFALGGILSEVLVERPPFSGATGRHTVEAAASGDVFEVHAALDMCGADAELVALAKRCLSPRRADRPADAKAVADAVGAYQAAVVQRLHRAETMRAAAEARAAELRKRRQTQGALVAAVLVIATLVAVGAWWQDRQAGERAKVEAERRGTRHGVERAIELAVELRKQYRFRAAGEVLKNAAGLAARAGAADLQPEIDRAAADLDFVVALDDVRMRRAEWADLTCGRGRFQDAEVPAGYARAFAGGGLDVTAGNPADVAARVAASAVRGDLVAALDDWSTVEPDAARRDRVLEVARRADPGPWLDRFRDPAVRADTEALRQLARDADPAALGPAAVATLGVLMEARGLNPVRVLTAAQTAHPDDFLLAFHLGQWFLNRDADAALGQFRAACAARPDNLAVLINIGSLLERKGDGEGGRAYYRAAIAVAPDRPIAHTNLGHSLWQAGDLRGAEATLREALRANENYARALSTLGIVLTELGDRDGGLEYLRRAVRSDPKDAPVLNNLATALKRRGDLPGAARAYEDLISTNPDYALGHLNLGLVRRLQGDRDAAERCFREAVRVDPKSVIAHESLGLTLKQRGDLPGAVRHLREAARLDPANGKAHYNLGTTLHAAGDLPGAAASLRAAVARDPKFPPAHVNLGITLREGGDPDAAVACFREAIRLDANFLPAHEQLAITLSDKDDWPAATAAFREVLRLNPNLAGAHFQVGYGLAVQGDTAGAIRSYRESVRLDPTFAPAHANLAYALLRAGDLDAAGKAFREAVRLDPRLPEARGGLQSLEHTAPLPRPAAR